MIEWQTELGHGNQNRSVQAAAARLHHFALDWHEDRYDLVASCVGPTYIRHEAAGERTVTAATLEQIQI